MTKEAEKYAESVLQGLFGGLSKAEIKHLAKKVVAMWENIGSLNNRVDLTSYCNNFYYLAPPKLSEFTSLYLSDMKNLEVRVGMFLTHCNRPEQIYDVMYETEGKINGEWVKGFTYGYVHKATGKWKTYWRAANNFDSDWKEFKTEDKQELFRI